MTMRAAATDGAGCWQADKDFIEDFILKDEDFAGLGESPCGKKVDTRTQTFHADRSGVKGLGRRLELIGDQERRHGSQNYWKR